MKVLQIGQENWSSDLTVSEEDVWHYTPIEDLELYLEQLEQEEIARLMDENPYLEEIPRVHLFFNLVLLTSPVQESCLEVLNDKVEAYTVFQDASLQLQSESATGFFRRKVLQTIPDQGGREDTWQFLKLNLFSGQYGARLKVIDMDIHPHFAGQVHHEGYVDTCFEGEFGQDFAPLFTYRYNLSSFGMGIELWPEYTKEGDIELQIEVLGIQRGSIYDIITTTMLSEEDFAAPYILEPNEAVGFYSISVYARGRGTLRFGTLHWRYSRMGLGHFIAGGKRHSDQKRQELFTYFNPGDMKPPLTVYFSGFRGAEGFEGFYMMKSLQTPFMLVADPRLEGGCFYSGTEELEGKVVGAIEEALDYLGFERSDVILSGLSMGTYGALYYAADFNPYGVVAGKPFTNLGETAERMRLKRPDEFATIGDMLWNIMGSTSQEAIEGINERFWNRFKRSNFSNTTFAIAYMKHDDYEGGAVHRLIEHLADQEGHIYSKGYDGRHNDNSRAINGWFMNQYKHLLEKGYGRNYK